MDREMQTAIERFSEHMRTLNPKSETAQHYQSDLKQFGELCEKSPKEVSRKDITEFITAQLELGLKNISVNRRLASLSRFFTYLADEAEDESWKNPVVWRLHRLKTGYHLPRDVAEEKIRQLWSGIMQGPLRDQVMFALMVDVGLRVGEVSNLTVEDIEKMNGQNQLWALRLNGKGNKERRVWLTPETANLLERYQSERPKAECQALFLTRRNQGISVRGIQDRLDYYRKKTGLSADDVSCHRLRHTFARRMAESRMPLPSLSHWLGHSHLTTTQHYIDGANPDIRADYERAMDRLSQEAECSDVTLVSSQCEQEQPMSMETEAQAQVKPKRVGLSEEEMIQRVSSLPEWLHNPIASFLRHQQLEWKVQYQRRRSQQWLGELRRGWTWLLEHRPITGLPALTRADVQAYIAYLTDLEYSFETINHFINMFKRFLSFSEQMGIEIAPALHRIQRVKREHALPRPLLPHEFFQLEQIILNSTQDTSSASNILDRAWFLILADAGLRIGELEALLVSDWNPNTRILFIRDAKSHRDRRVPVTERTALAIDSHLQQRIDSSPPNAPLLLRDGHPLTASYVRKHLHSFAAQIELKDVTPHRLRHTFATRLLNSGLMPITTLQKLMGHKHIDTTMLYVQLYDETIQQHYLAAMATHSVHNIPEPDPDIWGPTLENLFEEPADTQAEQNEKIGQTNFYCV